MTKEAQEFYIKHYHKLVGKTVDRVIVDNSSNEGFMGLGFTDGTIAWILQDPEGNGPGFLDIVKGTQ